MLGVSGGCIRRAWAQLAAADARYVLFGRVRRPDRALRGGCVAAHPWFTPLANGSAGQRTPGGSLTPYLVEQARHDLEHLLEPAFQGPDVAVARRASSTRPSTWATSPLLSSSKWPRAARTSRSSGSIALKISWSFSCNSARRAARVGEVRLPKSISANETEFACGMARLAERYFLTGVPHLDFQVMTVQCQKPLAGEEAEPGQEWRASTAGRGISRPHGRAFEVDVLEHVGGVDAPLQPPVEAEPDHPPQPLPMPREQFRSGPLVPAFEAEEQVVIVSARYRRS